MAIENENAVISVNGLSCTFGKKKVLDGINIDAQPGRVFGLVGENGAGKTTLIKHILGALTPQEGEVRVLGLEPTRDPVGVLSQLGYLSEDRDLPRWMRVDELMRYTQSFYPAWDSVYAEDLRKQFDIALDAKIKNLSRGGKAKAGLIMALAHRPKLLLLDEPSSGLDAVARREILGVVIRSIAEEGRSILFSSHLLDEVERVADDIAMIHEGVVALQMPMAELRAQHQRWIVRLGEAVTAFPAMGGLIRAEGGGRDWEVFTAGEKDCAKAALQALGAEIIDQSSPSLDNVFVARVQGKQLSESVEA